MNLDLKLWLTLKVSKLGAHISLGLPRGAAFIKELPICFKLFSSFIISDDVICDCFVSFYIYVVELSTI